MFRIICTVIILFASFLNTSCSSFRFQHAPVTRPVPVGNLVNYPNYPSNVKTVVRKALWLSKKNLNYTFGSANPNNGGMDCSGVINYLLKSIDHGHVPRDSYDMYRWLAKAGTIHHVTSFHLRSKQFDALKPGDLLFWANTYHTRRRPPITHVMLYLGKNRSGKPLMFGSSDGGVYKGKEMWGVSVFEFVLPYRSDRARFVAYGCIPNYTC
jgi:hypothetical protein